MKRVIIAGVFGVLAVAGATACQPPPPNYRPPIVDSVTQTSPQPAHPGEDVTFELQVHDDELISHAVARELVGPTGATLPGPRTCTASVELVGGLTSGVVSVTCPVPAFAQNGTWSLDVLIGDRPSFAPVEVAYPGTVRRLSFEVAGGSEDRSGPALVSYRTDPAVIGQETPFTLTMRVHDDTAPVELPYAGTYQFYKPFSNNSLFGCGDPVYTPVSATDTDISLSCKPGYYFYSGPTVIRSELGRHVSQMPVIDPLGQKGTMEMWIDVQP